MLGGPQTAALLGLTSIALVAMALPASANYKPAPMAVRADADRVFDLTNAFATAIASKPRLRNFPVAFGPGNESETAWLARVQAEPKAREGQAYALLARLRRGPMQMGTPQEETREPQRGRSERWLVASLEQPLTVEIEMRDLAQGQRVAGPFVLQETMRRRFEVEITGLQGFARTAKGLELGARLGAEMRKPPDEVFASVLRGAGRSLANEGVDRILALPLFKVFGLVDAVDAPRDRVQMPIGREVGLSVGDGFTWEQPNGEHLGYFRVRALAPNRSQLQPILFEGFPAVGSKLVEYPKGNHWFSPLVGGAFLGAPMVGGGVRLAFDAARIYGAADGFFMGEFSAFQGAGGGAAWGGLGIGGRSFLRSNSLGWRVLAGGMGSSTLTGGQTVPALAAGLSLDHLFTPEFGLGFELTPVVGWPVQLPGSSQASVPVGALGQLGLHLVF